MLLKLGIGVGKGGAKVFGCWAWEQASNGMPSCENKRTKYLEGSKVVLQR